MVETAPAMPAPWPHASDSLLVGVSDIAAIVVQRRLERKRADNQQRQARASETQSSAVAEPAPYDDADYASADSGSADDTEVSESQEETQSSSSTEVSGVSAGGDRHGGGEEAEVRAGGRQVSLPEAPESNVGAFGMYVANWNGCGSNEWVNDHLANDTISRNPAAMMMVCHVDHDFIHSLEKPSQCPRATSVNLQPARAAAPAVAGSGRAAAHREPNFRAWHVAASNTKKGNEDSNALIVAARSSLARACTVLEVLVLRHKKYKYANGKTAQACSKVLAAEIQWHRPMAGRRSLRVLNVHLHHDVAKQVLDAQKS